MKRALCIVVVAWTLIGCTTVRTTRVESIDDFSRINALTSKYVTIRLTDDSSFTADTVRVDSDSTWSILKTGDPTFWRTDELRSISFRTPGQTWNGMKYGGLVGFVAGALIGLADGSDPPDQWFAMTAGSKAVLSGIVVGLTGFLVGGMVAPGTVENHFVFGNQDKKSIGTSKIIFSATFTSADAVTGRSLHRSVAGWGFGKTSPRSCFIWCSGPTLYPRRSGSLGIRVGVEYLLSDVSSVKGTYSRTGVGHVDGYGGSSGSRLGVDHELKSFEATYTYRPASDRLGDYVGVGLGVGIYRPSLDFSISGASREEISTFKPGLVLDLSFRPLNRISSFEITAAYRLIGNWKYGPIQLNTFAGESWILDTESTPLGGLLFSAGISFRFR